MWRERIVVLETACFLFCGHLFVGVLIGGKLRRKIAKWRNLVKKRDEEILLEAWQRSSMGYYKKKLDRE